MATITFLAGKRCFDLNRVPFIVLFGLSPFGYKTCHVFEYDLKTHGVHLGDFLTAIVTPTNGLMGFKRIPYPMEINIIEHSAVMKFESAELTRDQNGLLVFQTKAFGPVPSFNQYLPPGSYEIIIKPSDSLPMKLIAEAKPILPLNLFNPVNASSLNFYEVPQSQLMKNHHVTQSGFSNLPVPSLDSNIPRPTSTMDSYYDYITLQPNMIPSLPPSDKNAATQGYEELQNCTSSKPETEEETLSELIAKLPTLDLNESQKPIPKPRKVFSSSNQAVAVQQPKPVLSVKPTKKVVFQLPIQVADSENEEIPETGKKMKAFVHSYQDQHKKRLHFVWVCDVKEASIFVSSEHALEIGHFFEGVFQRKPSGKLECTSYENYIPALLRGSIVFGKIELKAKITNYQSSETLKYPQVYVEHLGTVIDQKRILSPNCIGKVVKIMRLQFEKRKHFEWIITGLA